MKTIEDLALAAYHAALARNQDDVHHTVAEILSRPVADIDAAATWWMDRTMAEIGPPLGGDIELRVEMVADDSGDGIPSPVQQITSDEVAWVGRFFIAHVHRDLRLRWELWDAVPAGQIRSYLCRLLTTMTCTALAHQDASTGTQRWAATAHLN